MQKKKLNFNLALCEEESFFSKDKKNLVIDERSYYNLSKKLKSKYDVKLCNEKNQIFSFRKKNYEYCENIFKNLIPCISKALNKVHNLNWSVYNWELLLGFWLRKFIYINFYKYNSFLLLFDSFNITEVRLASSESKFHCSRESGDIQDLSINTFWNGMLNSDIVRFIDNKKIIKKIEIKIQNKKNYLFLNKTFYDSFISNQNLISRILISLSKILKFTHHKDNGLILSTYLSNFDEKKLQVLFGQLPHFYSPKKIKYDLANDQIREKLNSILLNNIKNKDKFENLVRQLLYRYMPLFIIENFKEIYHLSSKLGFPQNPKFIFTSNSFENDELFKVYLAKKKHDNKNLKYFVGQHGNSYITRIDNNFQNEVKTCDYFLSWGKAKLDNIPTIPLFNFKYKSLKIKKNKKLYIYMILRSLGYQTVPYDRFLEGKKEYLLVKSFLKILPKELKKDIKIKPHYSFFFRKNYFLNFLKNEEFLDYQITRLNYKSVIKNSKLVCFCYDSTGFLENLSLQIPSICLMPNYMDHLNNNVKHIYKKLKKSNLIFDNEERLNNFIKNNHDNIDDWWYSTEVQNTIKLFVEHFSMIPKKNYLREIKDKIESKLLKKII